MCEIVCIKKKEEQEREKESEVASVRARACRCRHVAYTCSGFSWSCSHSLATPLCDALDTRVHSRGSTNDDDTRQDNVVEDEGTRRTNLVIVALWDIHSTGDLAALSTPFLLPQYRDCDKARTN